MTFLSRRRARHKAQQDHLKATIISIQKTSADLQARILPHLSPEARRKHDRIEAANQAGRDLQQQAVEIKRYTTEYRHTFNPGQSVLGTIFRPGKMTPEKLHAAEYEMLPRAVQWERLAIILLDHVRIVEARYPLENVSKLRAEGISGRKLAAIEVKMLTWAVKRGKKELLKQQTKVDKQGKGNCAMM